MNQIQTWFERIAGVCHVEPQRYEFARALFARPPFDAAALQKPACWRRKRVSGMMSGPGDGA